MLKWFEKAVEEPIYGYPFSYPQLKKLTIIIPSYKRHDFLLRQCLFWRDTGAAIIIIDGSPNALPQSIQDIFKRNKVTYIHKCASFAARLSQAAHLIRTPYAILGGDDEFLLPSGLVCAIKKLDQTPELKACIGQSLTFFVGQKGSDLTFGSGYPHFCYSVKQSSVRERLINALSNYTAATAYAVMRAASWKQSYGNLQEWSSPYAIEMQQAISAYISGSLDSIDEVYWMRSSENRPINTSAFNRSNSFEEWWNSEKMQFESAAFVDLLAAELVRSSFMEIDHAKELIREIVEIFIAKANACVERPQTLSLRTFFVRAAKLLFPEILIQKFKSCLFNYRHRPASTGSYGDALALLNQNRVLFTKSEILFQELAMIERLIAGFYKARGAKTEWQLS